jgi:RNA polymerase sigma factor (sigma-70 family)
MSSEDDRRTGEELFRAHLDDINEIVAFECLYHHLRQSDAEDFRSLVFIKLIENDYGVFKGWERRCSLRGYLQRVIGNFLKDYLDSLWGKWRPSEAAKRLGPLGIALDQLMSRDRYSFEEACEELRTNRGVTLSIERLRQMADALPIRHKRRFEPDDNLVDVPTSEPGPDQGVFDQERDAQVRKLRAALREIIGRWPAQDALILMLRYWDDLSIAEIARMLQLPAKPLYPRVKSLLKQLRKELKDLGFDGDSVPEL